MNRIDLATAIVRRKDSILLVASKYANHEKPLWNLPGGRQLPGELLSTTAVRELREETGLRASVHGLCYVSESYDGDTHFINFTFDVEADGEPELPTNGGDHIAGVEWVPVTSLKERLAVAVVREPLLKYLEDDSNRYTGYAEAGISIVFPD